MSARNSEEVSHGRGGKPAFWTYSTTEDGAQELHLTCPE
jgi:hypothetical protein